MCVKKCCLFFIISIQWMIALSDSISGCWISWQLASFKKNLFIMYAIHEKVKWGKILKSIYVKNTVNA